MLGISDLFSFRSISCEFRYSAIDVACFVNLIGSLFFFNDKIEEKKINASISFPIMTSFRSKSKCYVVILAQ